MKRRVEYLKSKKYIARACHSRVSVYFLYHIDFSRLARLVPRVAGGEYCKLSEEIINKIVPDPTRLPRDVVLHLDWHLDSPICMNPTTSTWYSL